MRTSLIFVAAGPSTTDQSREPRSAVERTARMNSDPHSAIARRDAHRPTIEKSIRGNGNATMQHGRRNHIRRRRHQPGRDGTRRTDHTKDAASGANQHHQARDRGEHEERSLGVRISEGSAEGPSAQELPPSRYGGDRGGRQHQRGSRDAVEGREDPGEEENHRRCDEDDRNPKGSPSNSRNNGPARRHDERDGDGDLRRTHRPSGRADLREASRPHQ